MIDPITLLRAAEAGLEAAESHPDPPLVCFPLRVDWENTMPELGREPFPEPVTTSRQIVARVTWPAPALKLAEFAREHSWEVRTQYSQGHMPHATTGRPGALKDLIALRFGLHPMTDRQAYAVYSRNASGGTWAWSSVMIWGPDLPPYGGCGIADLQEFLREPDRPAPNMLAWVEVVRKRLADQGDVGKAREGFRKELRATYDSFTGRTAALSWPGALLAAAADWAVLQSRGGHLYEPGQMAGFIEKRSTKEKDHA